MRLSSLQPLGTDRVLSYKLQTVPFSREKKGRLQVQELYLEDVETLEKWF